MTRELQLGSKRRLTLHVGDQVELLDPIVPRGRPLDDPQAATIAALRAPLGFPALPVAVVPGDRVVVPILPDVPQAPAIVAGLLRVLLEAGAAARDITLLKLGKARAAAENDDADDDARSPLLAQLPEAMRHEITVARHDAAEQTAMAYVAASKDGDPIYINRLLSDADFVIPIGLAQAEPALRFLGAHNSLYPAFSDRQSQKRFAAVTAKNPDDDYRRQTDEVADVHWLLGLQFAIQVVPGPGDAVLDVLAGEFTSVQRRGRELREQAWRLDDLPTADLVIVSIEGGRATQTWENFAKALHVATSLVAEHGAIVLCTKLRRPPGPQVRRTAEWDESDSPTPRRSRERTPDALAAAALAEARQQAQLFLLSGLPSDQVEDLGVGYVQNGEQIDRLIRRHKVCIFVSNAHHVVLPSPPDDELDDDSSSEDD